MSVFLRKKQLKKGTYLCLVEAHYDPSKKNVNQKVIENIGYLEELKNTYTDPIAFFSEKAKRLSSQSSKKDVENKSTSNPNSIPREEIRKNIGHFLVKNVYDLFDFAEPFTFATFYSNIKFDCESAFKFLVYSQIVNPASKQKEYLNKDIYFDDFNFSDDQLYDAIKIIGNNEDLLKEYILSKLKDIVELDLSSTYFDCTNVYFEIDKENDELRRGPEKNNRHDPILGIGLLMDANGIPLTYTTFPGNQSEQPELHKNLSYIKKKCDIAGRTIIVADKGLNSGDNMYKAFKNNDGYVVGQKVRGAAKDCISWVLQDDENSKYRCTYDENNTLIFKIKSEIGEYPIQITSKLNGQKATVNLKQKRVIFWSKDYADKAQYERQKNIDKAKEIISRPKEFLKATVGTAASYIKEIKYDSNGEIITKNLELDFEAIEKEARLDGYYMIVTSETDLDDEKVISIYRGLWEIEETFSIIKGVLKIRPVFAKSLTAIHAHVLVCFTALVILRLLQKKFIRKTLSEKQIAAIEKANKRKKNHKINLKKVEEYPVTQIVDFIRGFNSLKISNNYYTEKYFDIIPFIEETCKVKLDKRFYSSKDIEKIFSNHFMAQGKS